MTTNLDLIVFEAMKTMLMVAERQGALLTPDEIMEEVKNSEGNTRDMYIKLVNIGLEEARKKGFDPLEEHRKASESFKSEAQGV